MKKLSGEAEVRKWALDRAVGVHLSKADGDRKAVAICETAQKFVNFITTGDLALETK